MRSYILVAGLFLGVVLLAELTKAAPAHSPQHRREELARGERFGGGGGSDTEDSDAEKQVVKKHNGETDIEDSDDKEKQVVKKLWSKKSTVTPRYRTSTRRFTQRTSTRRRGG